jgi:hypothetical protein
VGARASHAALVEHAFLDVAPEEIARSVHEAASLVVGGPVEVRIGAEAWGYRNVGVSLPRARRSRLEAANLRLHVSRAIEEVGVTLWPSANAPRVGGDIEGSVRVRAVLLRGPLDAASFAQAPPERAHVVGRH